MPKPIERFLLFLSDFLAVQLAFITWIFLRRNLGYAVNLPALDLLLISVIIFLFWFLLFLLLGLYRSWYAQSRFDEFVALLKAISFGVLIVFVLTIDLSKDVENPFPLSRAIILTYWLTMILTVGTGRMLLRTIQRKLLERGIGLRKTLIVGSGSKALELFERVRKYPALGYDIIGTVSMDTENRSDRKDPIPNLGEVSQLGRIIHHHRIEEVLIALEERERQKVFDIVGYCDGHATNLKIVPDLYDIVIGQARTNQIYGFPLIEILPELMPTWERVFKRMIDVAFSMVVLTVCMPIWAVVAIVIRLDSKGPVFYSQDRVGRNGKIFRMHKFRSMQEDAELASGPVWADKDDVRITRVGKTLRKLRIDEIPQLLNVLRGEMSLVGPRPERPYFVDQLKKEIPYYTRRQRIRPGITGWAQIKHKYDQSLDDVRKKLQYDLYYLENMSLRMDLKIIMNTIYTVFSGRGQ